MIKKLDLFILLLEKPFFKCTLLLEKPIFCVKIILEKVIFVFNRKVETHGHKLFYFDSKKVGEVDFIVNDYENLNVLPIEIKSGKDQNNFRAIPKLVSKDGNYKMPYGYVLGNKNCSEIVNDLYILPIYMIMFL